jgi:hypothetical protein
MHPDSGSFNDGFPLTDTGKVNQVTIGGRRHKHTLPFHDACRKTQFHMASSESLANKSSLLRLHQTVGYTANSFPIRSRLPPLTIYRVRPPENGALPKRDIRF